MTQLEEIKTFTHSEVFKTFSPEITSVILHKQEELQLNEYLLQFSNLHRNKFRGCYAPHKPVLLLAIAALVTSGDIEGTHIELNQTLKDKFKEVWNNVVPYGSTFRCEIRNPFTYMDYEPFWTLGENKNDATIDKELIELLKKPESRFEIVECLSSRILSDTVDTKGKHYSMNTDSALSYVAEELLTFIPFMVPVLLSV